MYIVMLGAPGTGKGTIGKILSEDMELTHISTGDIFREQINKKTDLGKKIEGYIANGALVPDDVVIAGNPARVICTLDQHLQKRRERTSSEALQVARSFVECYGKMPTEYDMRYFSDLFGSRCASEKKWKSYSDFLNDL